MKIERIKQTSISDQTTLGKRRSLLKKLKEKQDYTMTKGYMDAKWTAKCDTLMHQDPGSSLNLTSYRLVWSWHLEMEGIF